MGQVEKYRFIRFERILFYKNHVSIHNDVKQQNTYSDAWPSVLDNKGRTCCKTCHCSYQALGQ